MPKKWCGCGVVKPSAQLRTAQTSAPSRKVHRRGKGRRLAQDPDAGGIDERLSQIAAEVLAGQHVEFAWELFRLQYFPGREHEEVAAVLGAWSRRHGIKVRFEGRTMRGSSSASTRSDEKGEVVKGEGALPISSPMPRMRVDDGICKTARYRREAVEQAKAATYSVTTRLHQPTPLISQSTPQREQTTTSLRLFSFEAGSRNLCVRPRPNAPTIPVQS
jgi:hypothetical protein